MLNLLGMTYTAVLQDYSKETSGGSKYPPPFAHKTGFPSREAAWEWVINTARSIWPNSKVIDDLQKRSKRDPDERPHSARAIDFRTDKTDAAPDLHLAVTINDEPWYAEPNNFAPVQYPQY